MIHFKPTYLYIKTHNITGLRYLGKTTQKDPLNYTGSGTYWLRHLKKHGKDFSTEIIGIYENKEECSFVALLLSMHYDVVKSNDWANLKEENGLDGGFCFHSEETKMKIKEYQNRPDIKLKKRELIKEILSRPEIKEKILKIYLDPEFRTRHRQSIIDAVNQPEMKEKRKIYYSLPETVKRSSDMFKEIWILYREKIIEAQKKGQNAPGVQEKRIEKFKETNAKPEIRDKRSKSAKEANARPEVKEKIRQSMRDYNAKPGVKEKRSGIVKNYTKKKCDHCQNMIDPGNYAKHHGDKCRFRIIDAEIIKEELRGY